MAESVEEIRKQVKVYIIVFAALAALTVITVAVSYLDLKPIDAVVLALIIASVKASLVAGFFMHLFSEKLTIYLILLFTVIFFLSVLLLPLGQHKGDMTGITYTPTKSMSVEEHH